MEKQRTMFSALAIEMLTWAQVDNVRRQTEAGEPAHRLMRILKSEKKASKAPSELKQQQRLRHSWEDATYISTQAGGVAGVRR